MADPDRDTRPTADIDAHATELARLRQERDALRAWVEACALPPVPAPPTPGHQQRLRQWCQAQRRRARQQRRRGEEGA